MNMTFSKMLTVPALSSWSKFLSCIRTETLSCLVGSSWARKQLQLSKEIFWVHSSLALCMILWCLAGSGRNWRWYDNDASATSHGPWLSLGLYWRAPSAKNLSWPKYVSALPWLQRYELRAKCAKSCRTCRRETCLGLMFFEESAYYDWGVWKTGLKPLAGK